MDRVIMEGVKVQGYDALGLLSLSNWDVYLIIAVLLYVAL